MKVATWNLQGASSGGQSKWQNHVKRFLGDNRIDVFCGQEFGAVPAEGNLVYEFSDHVKLFELHDYYLLHYHWDQGGNRVNTAVAWKKHLTNRPVSSVRQAEAGERDYRKAIGVYTRGTAYFTIHAISGNARDVVTLLENVDSKGFSWLAAGDYNCEPDTLRQRLRSEGDDWAVCDPNEATHSGGKKLDYAVRKSGPRVTGTVIRKDASDHDPVIYDGV